jgi:hypothetical protein
MAYNLASVGEKLRNFTAAETGHEQKPGEKAPGWNYMPMMLPADVSAKKGGVVSVVPRQEFMDKGIADWRDLHLFRGAAILSSVGTLALLPYSVPMAGLGALVAGYFWGRWKRQDYNISLFYKVRWLLEST